MCLRTPWSSCIYSCKKVLARMSASEAAHRRPTQLGIGLQKGDISASSAVAYCQRVHLANEMRHPVVYISLIFNTPL